MDPDYFMLKALSCLISNSILISIFKVLLPEYGGAKLELDGEELQIFRETDIVAKMSS